MYVLVFIKTILFNKKMAHMLQKHAELSRDFQLEIEVKCSGKPIYSKRFSYFCFINKFPMYDKNEEGWLDIITLKQILEQIPQDKDKTYTYICQPIQPGYAEAFTFDAVPMKDECDGETLRNRIEKILQGYKVYIAKTFES
jgi:hypothetical protein